MSEIVPGSLEHWAGAKPGQIAIIDGDTRLSFAQWNDAANRVASALAALGVEPGQIVVLRTHIRHEWMILSSALAKLGCSLLGLNWRLTPEEFRHVLENSGAKVLICDDEDPRVLVPALDTLAVRLRISIDRPAEGFRAYSGLLDGEPLERFSRADPPLIIYTSGTTGLPKGVVMGQVGRHSNRDEVDAYRASVRESRRSASAHPVTLITMPMHHGSGPNQVWGALKAGRTMVLLRRFEPLAALGLIEQYRVTDWATVPTMLKRLAGLAPDVLARHDLSSIEYLSVGAAPVPWSLKEWVFDTFGEHCLYEGYGSTETGMVCRLTPEMQRIKKGSSGQPYRHVRVEIRDANGKTLAANTPGEIWISTPSTLSSYLNGKPLDEDTLDARGFFRVGDFGHLDEDGFLYITDRIKDMIIAGGVNIYPAEIEAVLIRHPAVQDVAVIGIPDDDFGEQVAAFCELRPGRQLDESELRSFAAASLAAYKCPRSIRFVDELPRNTMGKLLKRQLREPFWRGRERPV